MVFFPILKLPFLALEKIIKDCDPIDLIHFSLCSSRCSEFVRMARPKKQISKISWILEQRANGILIETGESQLKINILERPRAVPKSKKASKGIPMSFGNAAFSGQPALFHRAPLRIDIAIKESESRENLLKIFIRHLRRLFSCDLYHIEYESDPVDPSLLTHFLPIKTLNFKYSRDFCNFPFSGKIDNLRLEKRQTSFPMRSDNFGDMILPFRSMDLGYAPWFSFRNISNFVNLRVEDPSITNYDINQFLHEWTSGDHDQFEALIIKRRPCTFAWSLDPSNTRDILHGLKEVQQWGNTDRLIERDDGLRARVHCSSKGVHIYVLHPTLSENKVMEWCRWGMVGGEKNFYNYVNA